MLQLLARFVQLTLATWDLDVTGVFARRFIRNGTLEKTLSSRREPCGVDAVGESDSFGLGIGKPWDGTRRTLV